MVTIGRGQLDTAAHEFFDGLRSYDVPRAMKVVAADADFDSPWSGKLTGKAAIENFLTGWLKDAQKRPSLSIIDVAGDGAVTRIKLAISGRFGQAPQHVTLHVLVLKHVLHQIRFAAADKASH